MRGIVFKGEWKNNRDEGKYCSGAVIKDINRKESTLILVDECGENRSSVVCDASWIHRLRILSEREYGDRNDKK